MRQLVVLTLLKGSSDVVVGGLVESDFGSAFPSFSLAFWEVILSANLPVDFLPNGGLCKLLFATARGR